MQTRTGLTMLFLALVTGLGCDSEVDQFYVAKRAAQQGDGPRSVQLMEELGARGYKPAFNEIGVAYYQGLTGKRDGATAASWMERGAMSGMRQAQMNFAMLHLHGIGVPMDHDRAVEWYIRAADQGLVAKELIDLVIPGSTTRQRLPEATNWLRQQARLGDRTAQVRLATLLFDNRQDPVSLGEALRWLEIFRNAIPAHDEPAPIDANEQQPVVEANWQKPTRYPDGAPHGDFQRAVSTARAEAVDGDVEALFFLYRVLGPPHAAFAPVRAQQAQAWLAAAAEAGFPPALFEKAHSGASIDTALLEAAAESGHLDAMRALAEVLRSRGEIEAANRWSNRHRVQVLHYVGALRRDLEAQLTPLQQMRARDDARSWRPESLRPVPYELGAWPDALPISLGGLTVLASLILFFLAGRAWLARRSEQNVLLALILVADAFFILFAFAPFSLPADPGIMSVLVFTSPVILVLPCLMAGLYVAFSGTFESGLARPFSRRVARRVVVGVGPIASVLILWNTPDAANFEYRELAPGLVLTFDRWVPAVVLPLMVAAHCFVVAVLVQVYRSSADLDAKIRARAYLTAMRCDSVFLR